MSHHLRTTARATALFAIVLVMAGTAPATAAGAEHQTYEETYDGSERRSAEENPCGPWAMTIHEVRDGRARLLTPRGGQVEDELHVNGAVDGRIEITPDDPALPTYTGSYREKFNGVITGYDEQAGDLARVAQYRVRARLTGSDGSGLVLALSGKYTLNARGEMVVAHERMTCS